jgi:transitional endoplasmic reticulum ATPase
MDLLGVGTGDVIEVKGKSRTVAKCLPFYPSDAGKRIIRVDGLVKNNAHIGIGDTVIVKKIKAIPAQNVIVAPLQTMPPVDERYLADALESMPVITSENAAIVTQKTVFSITEARAEALLGSPQVSYEDIGWLREEIQKVREMIELPLRHPEIFEKLGIEAPTGVLLHGPPGTGKTLLAKAVANESNAQFITISGPEIMSTFYGESEGKSI